MPKARVSERKKRAESKNSKHKKSMQIDLWRNLDDYQASFALQQQIFTLSKI